MAAVFHPRNEWGGRNPSGGSLSQVEWIVIHHTAAGNAPTDFNPDRWRNLENSEIARGYSSLAYNFGVVNGPSGHIVESRGWTRGAATGGSGPNGSWNNSSIAIVIDGYFHEPYSDVPTAAALDAAADVIVNGVFLGFINPQFKCIPHSEASAGTQWATACPGDNLRGLVNFPFGSIEAIAKYKLQNAGAVAPIQPQPDPPGKPRCVGTCEKRTLRIGNSGVCVTTAQRGLTTRGFNTHGTDGKFGANTLAAVKCCQSANGLSIDGIIGPATWAVIV